MKGWGGDSRVGVSTSHVVGENYAKEMRGATYFINIVGLALLE